MKFQGTNILLASRWRLLAAMVLVAGSSVQLMGCKGNTTSAAGVGRVVGKPPVVRAMTIQGDAAHADPLNAAIWQDSQNGPWLSLTAPTNTTRMTTRTEAKVLFDDQMLYVAFINEQEVTTTSALGARDQVALFLDTTPAGKGMEMMEISVDSAGGPAVCTWIRSATPAVPLDDGSPDLGHPVSLIPNVSVPGLVSQVREGTKDGHAIWTAVIAVPINNLPLPLRTSALANARWKFNLVRTVKTGGGVLQSNLSPIQVNAQPVSPYRMADLELDTRD
jgi:hypothetical protein